MCACAMQVTVQLSPSDARVGASGDHVDRLRCPDLESSGEKPVVEDSTLLRRARPCRVALIEAAPGKHLCVSARGSAELRDIQNQFEGLPIETGLCR